MKLCLGRCLVLVAAIGLFASGGFAWGETFSGSLNINPSNSSLNVATTIYAIVYAIGDDDTKSGSDSSAVSGTLDTDFDWNLDPQTGSLKFNSLNITGGRVALDETISINIPLRFQVLFITVDNPITITGTNVAGTPTTLNPPSTLSPAVTPTGVAGQGTFNAADQQIILNEGTMGISGNNTGNPSFNLATDFGAGLTGTSTATNGTIQLTKNSENVMANTSNYTVSMTLPVQFAQNDLVVLDSSDAYAEADISVMGQIKASLTFDLDVIPTNGKIGDVNQDGNVNPLDIDAFKAGWLKTDLPIGKVGYMMGDLNFDGTTNLSDAYILHNALKNNGMGNIDLESLLGGNNVPEPASVLLCVVAGFFLLGARRIRHRG